MKERNFDLIRSVLNGKELKGVTKITMTNVHTGKEKVTVDHNLITGAVQSLVADNISGLGDYSKLLPIRNLFAGCLLYQNPVVPRGYYPEDAATNVLIGHAGDQSHTTANPRRGNPNAVESIVGDNYIRNVWTFDTSQALGHINAVCLCPGILGNMGLQPWDDTINPYQPFNVEAVELAVGASWSRALAIKNPIALDPINNKVKSIFVNGTTFEEITSWHDTVFIGLSRGVHDFIEASNRSATLDTSFAGNQSFTVFVTSSYYYLVNPASRQRLDIYRISKSDMSVTKVSATSSSNIFFNGSLPLCFQSVPAFPNTEEYFWWPTLDRTSYYKIPFAGGASFTLENVSLTPSGTYHMQPLKITESLMIGENFFFNAGTFYPLVLASRPAGFGSNASSGWSNHLYETVSAAFGYTTGSGGQSALGVALHNILVTTQNNLSEDHEKTADKVMKVEYTISEV